MLTALFGRNRRSPQSAAERLTALLNKHASLVVDDHLVATMGVGRKALYRIIYEMVRRERMFMLTDKSDQMLLMTNTEFNRFLFRQSGGTVPLPALPMETLRVEAEPETNVTAEIVDLDWFTLDVAPEETAEGTEAPEYRQSLPERKREPWTVLEDIAWE